jgi:hypothetical protein
MDVSKDYHLRIFIFDDETQNCLYRYKKYQLTCKDMEKDILQHIEENKIIKDLKTMKQKA